MLCTVIVTGTVIFFFRPFAAAPAALLLDGVKYHDPQSLCTLEVNKDSAFRKKNVIRIKISNTDKSGYCSWVLPLRKYDASGKKSITFSVKGEIGDEKYNVGICDSGTYNGNEPKVRMTATDKWEKVRIPLDKFAGQNLKELDNLSFGFDSEGDYVIYIADVYFEP